eukprot:Gb_29332 [translate_table: standard]
MSIHRISFRKTSVAWLFSNGRYLNPFSTALTSHQSIERTVFPIFCSQKSTRARRLSIFSLKFSSQSLKFYYISLQSMHINTFPGGEAREKQEGNEELIPKNELGGDDLQENQPNNATEDANAVDPESQDVQQIFQKMKETGLIPNAVAMLDGLCKDGLVQEAMRLFGEMREKGSIPEVVIYTAVVDGFCRAWKLNDAKRVFKKMQANGIVPNAFSYTVLIQGLCKDRKLEDAAQFSLEMLEKGWRPNVATYILMVDAFCKEQKIDDARRVISQMKEKGFVADERSVRDYMDKKGPFFPSVWEVMFGKKAERGRA